MTTNLYRHPCFWCIPECINTLKNVKKMVWGKCLLFDLLFFLNIKLIHYKVFMSLQNILSKIKHTVAFTFSWSSISHWQYITCCALSAISWKEPLDTSKPCVFFTIYQSQSASFESYYWIPWKSQLFFIHINHLEIFSPITLIAY